MKNIVLRQVKSFGLLLFIISGFLLIAKPALAILPDDPQNEQWGYADIRAYEAWDYSTGSKEVVVAIIDNGFDTFHPDIRENAWKNEDEIAYNGIDDDNNGYTDDVWGWNFLGNNNIPRPNVSSLTDEDRRRGIFHHGTIVAGIIGAVGNNGKDGVGINWQVKLMNLKALSNSGNGDLGKVREAIFYAVDNGADILNISVVGGEGEELKKAIKYAYDNGVAVIAAAGNEDIFFENILRYPICVDADEEEEWVLGVSAIDDDHYIADFSNYGSGCIDITAPGVGIASTLRYSPTNGLHDRFGGTWTGTSFATPFVSGAAALIKAVRPDWGPTEIFDTLLSTTHHTPGQNEEIYAHLFGAGLLQIDKAVKLALGEALTTHNLRNFSLFNFSTRDFISLQEDDELGEIIIPDLLDIDDIAIFRNDDGREGYITVERQDKQNSLVNIYNHDWELENYWTTKTSGKSEIIVGNVHSNQGLEILLAPQNKDDLVFKVLNFDGKELVSVNLSGSHTGSSLGLIDNGGDLQHVLAMYRHLDLVKVIEFDNQFNILQEIELPFLHDNGSVDTGDIDGDGDQEIIIAAGAHDVPFLAFYERGGDLIKRFFAYGFQFSSGIDLVVGDYDGDNLDDVVTVLQGQNQALKVWNLEGKKIGQVDIATEKEIGRTRLLSIK